MSTLTTLGANDTGATSRTTINSNFTALNTDKIETSVLDTDGTLAANSDSKVATQKAVKTYVDSAGVADASTTVRGVVEEATQAEADARTAVGGTGSRLFINPSKAPFPWTIDMTTVSAGGNERIIYGDELFFLGYNSTSFIVQLQGYRPQSRLTTSDWAGSDTLARGAVLLGNYIYIQLYDNAATPDENRVYRYAKNDIASGGTLMTFSGATVLTNSDNGCYMTSDGTYFYFSYNAGNSANSYVLAKYSLSGTTFTYVSSITCGSTAFTSYIVKSNGDIYAERASSVLAKYNSSGTEQWASPTGTFLVSNSKMANFADNLYVSSSWGAGQYTKIITD